MAATESTMLALGTAAPDFRLPDFEGKQVALDDFRNSKGLLVAFICNHCPFVKHVRPELARFAKDYQPKGIAVVAINSNDIEAYPQDGPKGMAEEARSAGYIFPYLLDETQQVAKAYRAACTPDFFLFDADRKLVYRGQFDDSRPGRSTSNGADIRAACDALLSAAPIPAAQKPSIGCNIKWKK
jgi:thiol-disulfide isomerase/thioredoxin